MALTSKHKANIALAQALSYFGNRGYYLFLPVGDNGGPIDLAISEDGTTLERVQCKYTTARHTSMEKRYPGRTVWQVHMRLFGREPKQGQPWPYRDYAATDFDWLFVATPGGNYLIDWPAYCAEHGTHSSILLGQKAERYRV